MPKPIRQPFPRCLLLLFLAWTLPVLDICAGEAGKPRVLAHYSITSANDFPGRDPRDWKLLGSSDGGESWHVLDQRTNQVFLERYESKNFSTVARIPCHIFRLEITNVRDPRSANSVQVADIDLKGTIDGDELVDLRPRRSDLVTVQGEYAPGETRRMAFDANLHTKWLDFNLNEQGERGTWIQWQYDSPPGADPDPVQPLTRVAELNTKARTWARERFLLKIDAVVVWRSETENTLVLHDASGAALVKLASVTTNIAPGTLISLTGTSFLIRKGGAVELMEVPLVDNDGVHEIQTESGSIFLRAGRHPITVEWFNKLGDEAFALEYEGPGTPRQKVPESALYQFAATTNAPLSNDPRGLRFRYYEGEWDFLPTFSQLKPAAEGIVHDLTVAGRAQSEHCGLVFSGFIEVPRDGEYRFFLTSDDGSRLFIGDRHLQVHPVGTRDLPVAPRLPAGSAVLARDHYQWVSGEGEVTYIGEGRHGSEMVLQSRSGAMTVLFGASSEVPANYLLGSRVRVQGICVPTSAPDGNLVAGEIITPTLDQVRVSTIGARHWREFPIRRIGDILPEDAGQAARFRGWLSATNGAVTLVDATGEIRIAPSREPRQGDRWFAEALGQIVRRDTGWVLRLAEWRELGDTTEEQRALPPLRTIEQIHALRSEEAGRGYPVKVRGVVTCAWPDSENAVLQDGTRGIFVPNLTAGFDDWPEVGDFFEVEGRTDPGGFAPVIIPDRVSRLGKGAIPEPLRPTWAQLLNGSMDMQYVEIRGVVSSVEGDYIWLLMRGGKLRLQMVNMPEEKLRSYENAIVRLRGCLAASWNAESRKVIPGEVIMNTVSVSVELEAPRDLFSVPVKRAGDLLLFDAQADDLQRIKVFGQLMEERNGFYYMVDGDSGIRFVLKQPKILFPGDLIEVVGFPRAEGPAVVLRDAIVRQADTGTAAKFATRTLPHAKELTEEDLLNPENDAMRVTLQARVLGLREQSGEDILELQHGQRTFQAYVLRGRDLRGRATVGSLVEVTGVYSGLGAADQRKVEAFELLVNSSRDVQVIESPPWWTMKHSSAVGGAMIVALLSGAAWIRALRREVARKTQTLQCEVEERKNAEELAHRARRQAEAAAHAAEAGSRAKSQFLATMSHEIRTPMNGILGMNNLLLESGLTREQRELAETVNASSEALLTLLNDVLDFSKIEAGKLTLDRSEFNLRETVEGAVDLVAERAQSKGLELNYWIDLDLPTHYYGDPGRIRQVLLNLLTNALKFTERGEIFLEVAGEQHRDETMLRISVRDTGIGITPETQQRVFQAFEQADQTTTRKYGGTGLGLAICKCIVELMGGRIGLTSAPGKGSAFWFTLPLTQVAPSTDGGASNPASELSGVRLLVIEKHPSSAKVLEDFARAWRMEIETVNDLSAASSWLADHEPRPCTLVLVDVGVFPKGPDGSKVLDFLQQFCVENRAHNPRVGLLTSMYERPGTRDLNCPYVQTWLSKPARKIQLRNVLLQLLHESPAKEHPSTISSSGQAPVVSKTRILLAEDNVVNQRVALKQLARLGYAADVVGSGVQVLEAIAHATYDIILMDCHMPEMDGYEATRRIRELPNSLGKVHIIAMTANAMQGDREKCIEAGMNDYVAKPVKLDELRAALEGRSHLADALEELSDTTQFRLQGRA